MFRILRFLFSITIGLLVGLLFAQKPGKDLRQELQKSKVPGKTLIDELKGVKQDATETIQDTEVVQRSIRAVGEHKDKLSSIGKQKIKQVKTKVADAKSKLKKGVKTAEKSIAKKANITIKKIKM